MESIWALINEAWMNESNKECNCEIGCWFDWFRPYFIQSETEDIQFWLMKLESGRIKSIKQQTAANWEEIMNSGLNLMNSEVKSRNQNNLNPRNWIQLIDLLVWLEFINLPGIHWFLIIITVNMFD